MLDMADLEVSCDLVGVQIPPGNGDHARIQVKPVGVNLMSISAQEIAGPKRDLQDASPFEGRQGFL
jgi:hypothetical protein